MTLKTPVIAAIIFAVTISLAIAIGGWADTLVETETMRLKNFAYKYDGHTIICNWLENPKLLSGKVNTGLSCVVLPEECPQCPKCEEKRKLEGALF